MPLSSKVRDRCRTYLGTDEHRPKQIWKRLPRDTELGPVLTVSGLKLEIDEEYVAAVRAANLEIGGDALPGDPYPGG
ncbi:hypothetical protein [Amycolatopsis sp.]|uniref:hypothetical protein n=1 Tax=Amycolatopsis sp. TaxID=37632 RepID=UPI002D7EFF7A|nr:hypothetical protein [Amycolatopsis sp.]HET6709576.1 hypothetical protein [Amycolatopsis sp.]